MQPLSINFHLWKPCNYKCRFCFATFPNIKSALSFEDARRLLTTLREAGGEKLNFVGGEPTLHPHINDLVAWSHELGFVTSIVTNGAKLPELLNTQAHSLDWVGLSVDSANEHTQKLLGRGKGDHVQRSITLFEQCRDSGVRTKLNSVITRLNYEENMHEFVCRIRPERWKVFQVLPVNGQNDGRVEELLITSEQFECFINKHENLNTDGLKPIAESNDLMTDSYIMIDPLGRFYNNTHGHYVYSESILEVGVKTALSQSGWDNEKFIQRGGLYNWQH